MCEYTYSVYRNNSCVGRLTRNSVVDQEILFLLTLIRIRIILYLKKNLTTNLKTIVFEELKCFKNLNKKLFYMSPRFKIFVKFLTLKFCRNHAVAKSRFEFLCLTRISWNVWKIDFRTFLTFWMTNIVKCDP